MWEAVALVGLASATLTRVATLDTIADPLRARITSDRLEQLVTCPWCISFWLTIPLHLISGHPSIIGFLASWQIAKTAFWATEALAAVGVRE